MRPGWFLQDHAQLLVDMKARGLVLTQSAYPPLVSATVSVAWRVSGVHSARVGVTTLAVLNACALPSPRRLVDRAQTVRRGWRPGARGRWAGRGTADPGAGTGRPAASRGRRWWWAWLPRSCWSWSPRG